MNADEKEAHMRRMLAHGRKVLNESRQMEKDFEKGCREFWDFMRTVHGLCEPPGTKKIWDHIHGKERT